MHLRRHLRMCIRERNSPATGVFFTLDPAEWATKQDLLSTYSENVGTSTYIIHTTELNGVYFPFLSGTYTNMSTHTSVSLPDAALYTNFTNTLTTGTWNVEVELQAGSTNQMVFTTFDGNWASVQYTEFTGLTTSFQTFTHSFAASANGIIYMNFGYDGFSSSVTQTTGTVLMRNMRIYQSPVTCAISAPLTTGNITSTGNIQCLSLLQTSDASIKTDINNASLDTIQSIFDAVQVKTYERTDVPGQRIGFIANELVAALDETGFDNITQMTNGSGNPLWGLDYGRLGSTILWGVAKRQQAQLAALTARVAALENPA